MKTTLTLSQAIDGFLLELAARQLSAHTVRDYTTTLRRFQAFLGGDPLVATISREQISAFLASLAEVQPLNGAVERPPAKRGKKTILNYHTGLSALWTWLRAEGLVDRHLVREIPRPTPEQRAVVPFSEADVRALLAACDRSRTYARRGKRASDHGRPTALRDRAILFLLVDTGIRASELTGLRAQDVDLKNRRVYVNGKGDRERWIPISADTSKVVWKYLNARAEDPISAPLFVKRDGQAMNRVTLLQLLKRLGQRAGVVNCHPHRFRHTFAVNFLRNGGNAFELQMALGHSTLEMVRVYLSLAQTDLDAAHRQASPVANWRLKA